MENILMVISAILILTGSLFMLAASIGMIRLPDFYIRISVITKASTIGLGFILAGIVFYFHDISTLMKVVFMLTFILLTSPVSAHIFTKAASEIRIPFWKKTQLHDYLQASETPDDPQLRESSYGRGRKKKPRK